jgi:tRNA threonylcarbamoyladenosine biosynthesis protein TsaE
MAILGANSLEFISHSTEQTERLGIRLGQLIESGDLICLSGELGTGKTVLVRGMGRGWGSAVRVTSPTFTLVNVYPRARDQVPFYHMDCYRLRGPQENADAADVETTGVMDLLEAPGAMVIEWAERIKAFLPEGYLWIRLKHVDNTKRSLRFDATGERAAEMLRAFKRDAFGA